MTFILTIASLILCCITGCVDKSTTAPDDPVDEEPSVEWENFKVSVIPTKWHNDLTAAVTLTYDAPWYSDPLTLQAGEDALSRGLTMSYEVVTDSYVDHLERVTEMRDLLMPKGITFYGHGHKHENFDDQDYGYSFESFTTCFDYMEEWGLTPKAYAYPFGKGIESTTRLANRSAGFICARGLTFFSNPTNYICQNEETEPLLWHYLPSISVARDLEGYVNNHSMMSDVLAANTEKRAWIIVMYHSLGFPDGWGYYPYEDYLADLDEIAEGDFWCESMGTIACYVQEKNKFVFAKKEIATDENSADYEVRFWDGLDNDVFDFPLTLDMTFDFEFTINSVEIDLPNYESNVFEVIDNKLRLHVVPDEERRIMKFIH